MLAIMMSEAEDASFGSGVHVFNCDGGLTVAATKAIDDSSVRDTGVGNLTAGVLLVVVVILGVVRIRAVQLSHNKLEISLLLPIQESKVWEPSNSNKESGASP